MPSPAATGVGISIGAVLLLLRRAGKQDQAQAQQLVAETRRREMVGQHQEAQRRDELLQRERSMTQARMRMALQDRGIYAYGDPTSAPYIAAAAAQPVGRVR